MCIYTRGEHKSVCVHVCVCTGAACFLGGAEGRGTALSTFPSPVVMVVPAFPQSLFRDSHESSITVHVS